jgi:hypothetical protein
MAGALLLLVDESARAGGTAVDLAAACADKASCAGVIFLGVPEVKAQAAP